MNHLTTTDLEPTPAASFDRAAIRRDFPALHQDVHGRPLVYLDSAATALKPQSVIDAVCEVYAKDCANVHRGVHELSQRATAAYEAARAKVAEFIGAETDSVVFVKGTTEAINLVAQTWGRDNLRPKDRVLLTHLEHHSNIVPWQMLRDELGIELVVVPVTDRGEVLLEEVEARLDERVKLVACAHVSNTLGTKLPVEAITEAAHRVGARVMLDGAQAVPHLKVNVAELDCDFYAFGAHKLYGPTGVGALYGKPELLATMRPFQGGGDMIKSVRFEQTEYAAPPSRFEAGTPHIAGAVGFGAAVDYVTSLGRAAIEASERDLLAYATERVSEVPGLRIVGTAEEKVAVVSFVMEAAHPHDIGTILDAQGVAIRTGHHCTQPLMERLDLPATARLSLGVYNTEADIDRLMDGLGAVRELFA